MTAEQAATPNGNGNNNGIAQTPEELAVAHGIASYQQLRAERDELQKKVDRLEQILTVSKIEIEGLRAENEIAATRIESYQAERDHAVTDLATYQALFTTLQGILRTFGIEHAPLLKKITLPTQPEDHAAPAP
jgi:chromosome segregation ATPase